MTQSTQQHRLRPLLIWLGRLLLRIFAHVDIINREKYTAQTQGIVIANHVDSMDGVLIALLLPFPVEIMAADDLPYHPFFQWVLKCYGVIGVKRGAGNRGAVKQVLSQLKAGRSVLIFPEGGTWKPEDKPYYSGVAWLSYQSKLPLLPISLSGTHRALHAMLRFKRPHLMVHFHDPIAPPENLTGHRPDKAQLQSLVDDAMAQIYALVPLGSHQRVKSTNGYNLTFKIFTDSSPLTLNLNEAESEALAHLLYDPLPLETLRDNLKLPVQVLLQQDVSHKSSDVHHAIQSIVDYVEKTNPYYFYFLYGDEKGATMFTALKKLDASLAQITTQALYLSTDITPSIT